jgi:hypothetical protein
VHSNLNGTFSSDVFKLRSKYEECPTRASTATVTLNTKLGAAFVAELATNHDE